MKLRATLPLGLLALTALALAAQGIDLKWSPKVGDKATYKIDGKFEIPGIGDITLGGTRSEEVTKIDGDKVTATGTSKMTANAMGNDIPVPESKETTVSKIDGTVLELKVEGQDDAAGASMRISHVTALIFPGKPVAINDTWTAQAKKDEKLDIPGYKIEYKLIGEEKVDAWDTYKITSKGGETEGDAPTKVEATFWVEKSTGNVVKSTAKLTDALFSPQAPPLSGTMVTLRQPDAKKG